MKHTESKTQSACVRWFRYQYPEYAKLLISVPNGVATTAAQHYGISNKTLYGLIKSGNVREGVSFDYLTE